VRRNILNKGDVAHFTLLSPRALSKHMQENFSFPHLQEDKYEILQLFVVPLCCNGIVAWPHYGSTVFSERFPRCWMGKRGM